MSSCGKTVREIRIGKGIRQNELYEGILSKSFSISFEQGKHDISYGLLQQILAKLEVSINEFQYIEQGYDTSQIEQFFVLFSEYANSNNIEKLGELLEISQTPKNALTTVKSALIRSKIDQLLELEATRKLESTQINPEDRMIIADYFSSIQTWTFFDILLYAASYDIFEYHEKRVYFKMVLHFIKKYKKLEFVKSTLCVIYINLIYDLLLDPQYLESRSLVDKLMTELKDISQRPTFGFYRIMYNLYEGLMSISYEGMIHQQRATVGEEKAQFAIRMLQELDQPLVADIYSEVLRTVMDRHSLIVKESDQPD